jgi:hypothetical protein
VSDFYGYVGVDDDITQYSDTGLRKALAWARDERRAYGDDSPIELVATHALLRIEASRRGLL